MEDPTDPPQSRTSQAALLDPTEGQGIAPVETFMPQPGAPNDIIEILSRALPRLQLSVGVIRNLPRWLEDDMAELPATIRVGMQEKLDGLTSHAVQLDAGLRAIGNCTQIGAHRLRPSRIDAARIIEQVVRQRMAAAGRRIDVRIDLPLVDTDAELLSGITGALCDTALSTARRESDRIEIRAIHTEGTVRISALYPGPPLTASEGGSLFDGGPQDGLPSAAATLGLAYVWQAVARLGGRIELGPGFRGTGARITAILPPIATETDLGPPA